MLKFSERTESWNMMMLSPKATAAKHARRRELGFLDGVENFGTPIVMTYLPVVLGLLVLSGNLDLAFIALTLAALAFTVSWIFLISFCFTALAYLVAKTWGEKVEFGRLYYMVSIASAPTFVFTIVINVAMLILKAVLAILLDHPAAAGILTIAGNLVAVSVTIYGLYLLTICMDALFKFGLAKALAIWLAPALILLVVTLAIFGSMAVFSVLDVIINFF